MLALPLRDALDDEEPFSGLHVAEASCLAPQGLEALGLHEPSFQPCAVGLKAADVGLAASELRACLVPRRERAVVQERDDDEDEQEPRPPEPRQPDPPLPLRLAPPRHG